MEGWSVGGQTTEAREEFRQEEAKARELGQADDAKETGKDGDRIRTRENENVGVVNQGGPAY
jgi:hypothetical protein